MKKQFILIAIFVINISCIYYSVKSTPQNKDQQTQINNVLGIESEVDVSAFIGRGKFSVFGYAPSNSLVTLSGIGLYSETYSQENGFFEFNNQYLPIALSEPCISAKDHLGRLTTPVCLPSIPKNYNPRIGPFLLPPTISVDKQDYFKGDEVVFSGQAITGSKVNLSMFTDKVSSSLSMSVYAYTIPEISAETDNFGNYSIILPSSKIESFRVFVQSNVNNEMTPKSNTIRIKILPLWMYFIMFLGYLWQVFKQRIIEIIIISQIIALTIYLFQYYFHPNKIITQRAIILRSKYPLAILQHS